MNTHYTKVIATGASIVMLVALNGCNISADGKNGAHSSVNLLNEGGGQLPIAKAGADQNVSEGTPVTLDGSASSDPDGTITRYTWQEGSTTLGATVSVTKTDFTVGEHSVKLTVTDNDGNTDTDTVTVTVNSVDDTPVNHPPKADAGDDQSITLGNFYGGGGSEKVIAVTEAASSTVTVTLDGSGSTDDGWLAPMTYRWALAESQSGNTPTMEGNATQKPTLKFSCGTAFGDTNNCEHNTTDHSVTCKYTYTLVVNDGQYKDDDNVTITAHYLESCFPG